METEKRICFRLYAPKAHEVAVVGTFNHWSKILPMEREEDGTWRLWMSLAPGCYEYRFMVDGSWTNDPNCTQRLRNAFGAENDVLNV